LKLPPFDVPDDAMVEVLRRMTPVHAVDGCHKMWVSARKAIECMLRSIIQTGTTNRCDERSRGECCVDPFDLLKVVADVCTRLGIRYVTVGSMATITYGEPRFTNDIDILIDLSPDLIDEFCRSFPDSDYYLSRTAVETASLIGGSSTLSKRRITKGRLHSPCQPV